MKEHNRRSIRLRDFDYSQERFYFVTICSYKGKEVFGSFHKENIELSDLGKLIDNCLKDLKNRFEIVLDKYVVMSNHIHLIIQIVGANHDSPKMGERAIRESPVQIGKRSLLSKIIGFLKADVSRKFGMRVWHRNYYDRVVRNRMELERIREYIIENPKNWHRDRNNIKISSWVRR